MDSLAACSFSALKYTTSFPCCCSPAEVLGFVSDAFLLSCLFLLPSARDRTVTAMEWEPWVVQHGQCPMQLLRWWSINSLFSNCMQRELMHLLFTRHVRIARWYKSSSALWFNHKTDCKDAVVSSIGMEVVMWEKKKKIVTHWECTCLKTCSFCSSYMNIMRKQAYSSGLSSIMIKVPVHEFISGEPGWGLMTVSVQHPNPNSQHEIKFLPRNI